MGKNTPGPWLYTNFLRPDGKDIRTVEDVAETVAFSARRSDRAELWGATLDDNPDGDGCPTVVCYTGNGPNAHNNARLIAAAPELLALLSEFVNGAHHDRTFLTTREKIHPDGVSLFDKLVVNATAAISKATGGV